MEPINRIKNCINWIISRFPFFASVLIPLNLIADENVKTAATDGINLKFSPAWINSLSRDHLIFLLLHESGHILFKHHLRMQGKNTDIWNQATDYAINAWLIQQGFKPIPKILYDPAYANFSSEKIYNILLQNQQEKEQGGNQGNNEKETSENLGKIEPFPVNDPEKIEQQEKEINSKIQQGGILGELAGAKGGVLQEWIKQQRIPKLTLTEILQDVKNQAAKNDYTWDVPNFRYSDIGYLPSLHNFELGKIACFVDASGSVDLSLFSQLITEIQDAKQQGINFDLFLFDVSVYQEIYDFQGDENIQISQGGTDFNCIPKHLEKLQENYAAIVIFTDGFSSIDTEIQDCFWLIYDNPSFSCNFGKVYHLQN